MIPPALRRHDVFLRSNSQQSKPEDRTHRPPFKRHRRTHRKKPKDGKAPLGEKMPISVPFLGEQGDILVVKDQDRRPYPGRVQEKSVDQSSLSLMLDDIEASEIPRDKYAVAENFELLRRFKPGEKLSPDEWHDHRHELWKSFTNKQLSTYISEFVSQKSEVQDNGEKMSFKWRPGVSAFLDSTDAHDANRVTGSKENVKAKDLLVERILRDCWKLGIMGETGQLDYQLPPPLLSLLAQSPNFSFEVLASLHDARVDLTHSLGLVRITGTQKSCEALRDVVHDATARIQQEDLQIISHDDLSAKTSNRIFTPEFLSWISTTYGVAFEQHASQPSKMFYLAENRQGANDAKRTLNLAIYDTTTPQAPFGTYMSASEPIEYYDFNPENNTTWWNRGKPWFRWAVPPAQSAVAKVLEMPFFAKQETRLSEQLLKLLRQKSQPKVDQDDSAKVCETVSAAVGRCLFLRKPSLLDESISANELGQMSVPRTFTTDIPRVTSILRRLPARIVDDSLRHHRIQLIPSFKHANVFPDLEVEFTVQKEHGVANPRTDVLLHSAKMVLSKARVDYLLPENALDLRFTRKLTRELLGNPQENPPLQNLQETLQDVFSKARVNQEDRPLPSFIDLSLPNEVLRSSTEDQDPSGQTTAEYIFLPANDIRTTALTRYEYHGHELNYSYFESGPYCSHRTTDFYLDMDITEGQSDSATNYLMQRPVNFRSFYKAACELAFDGDRAWRGT